ncbi:LacI family DNA-binding transcriptional regulator [Kiritimatiellota bacterium B12222]|nr:LacI family DNA-binding transcriptional regulator [Kiritimatiellota bacterium B12222]
MSLSSSSPKSTTPKRRQNVTLADIARQVGVAPQVVSIVLNGGKGTASARPEIRDRIREVATELGYRPFSAGQALRRGAFQSVGLLIGPPEDFLLTQPTLSGLVERLAESDYTATLVHTRSSSLSGLMENPLVRSRHTDGLLIPFVRTPSARLREELSSLQIPVVWMNRSARHNAIRMDEGDAAAQLVSLYHRKGRKSVTFVDYSSGGRDAHTRERIRSAEHQAQKLGMNFNTHLRSVPRDQRGEAVAEWLKTQHAPLHLIVNSLSAAQIILQVGVREGWKVPETLSLASFDNGKGFTANVPAISCAVRPDYLFGIRSAEMILEQIQSREAQIPSERLSFDVIEGGTT